MWYGGRPALYGSRQQKIALLLRCVDARLLQVWTIWKGNKLIVFYHLNINTYIKFYCIMFNSKNRHRIHIVFPPKANQCKQTPFLRAVTCVTQMCKTLRLRRRSKRKMPRLYGCLRFSIELNIRDEAQKPINIILSITIYRSATNNALAISTSSAQFLQMHIAH